MGILDSILADDMAVFTDPDVFGESVVITNTATGAVVTVNAAVLRLDVQPLASARGSTVAAKALHVLIASNDTTGIASIDLGAMTVALAERTNGPIVTKRVSEIVHQGSGAWLLKLQ